MDFNGAVIGLVVVGILGLLAAAWGWAVVKAGKLGVEDAIVAWGGHPPGDSPATLDPPAHRPPASPWPAPLRPPSVSPVPAALSRASSDHGTPLPPSPTAFRTTVRQHGEQLHRT